MILHGPYSLSRLCSGSKNRVTPPTEPGVPGNFYLADRTVGNASEVREDFTKMNAQAKDLAIRIATQMLGSANAQHIIGQIMPEIG